MTTIAPPTPSKLVTRTGLLREALRLRRTKIGLVLTTLVIVVAVLGPFIAPNDPFEFLGVPFQTPGNGLLAGADQLGRDVWSQFLNGGWRLLVMSAIATFIGVTLGAILGIYAGYRGGWPDEVVMRLGDVLLAFPQVVLALLFISVTGPNLAVVVLLVAIGHTPRVARVMRGATLSCVGRDYVRASEAVGTPTHTIIGREILPNVSGPLAVEFGLRLTYSIGLIAGLSFLGLGVQPPTPDWGLMVNEGRIAITVQPWSVLLPVVAIALLTIGMNLFSDGLARASAGIDRGVQE